MPAPPAGKPTVPIRTTLLISYAPETDVAGRGIQGVRAPGRNPVAVTVGVVAKVRSSPYHLRLPGGRAHGISAGTIDVKARVKPIRAPLPDVARDVVEPVPVRLEGLHGCRAEVAVLKGVVRRERALPDVAAPLALRC